MLLIDIGNCISYAFNFAVVGLQCHTMIDKKTIILPCTLKTNLKITVSSFKLERLSLDNFFYIFPESGYRNTSN